MEYTGDRFLIYSWKLEEHQLKLLAKLFFYNTFLCIDNNW